MHLLSIKIRKIANQRIPGKCLGKAQQEDGRNVNLKIIMINIL